MDLSEEPLVRDRVRRRVAAAAVLALAASGVTLAASPASAHGRQTVIAGNARFQVLSPTLIRTEYSPSGRFSDAGTFNVIGRDDFAPARFTKRVARGWLTIETGAATLRYRVGSGPFSDDNL